MKQLRIRILSVLMAFAMLASLLPIAAMAEEPNVAAVGEKGYPTLEEAVSNAKTGDTVKLLTDVQQNAPLVIKDNKSVTLDLNGKNISGTVSTNAGAFNYIQIWGGAALTVTDHSENKSGSIGLTETGNDSKGLISTQSTRLIYNAGTFALKEGTLKLTATGSKTLAGVYSVGAASTTTLAGGRVQVENNSPAAQWDVYGVYNNGTLHISGTDIAVSNQGQTAPVGIYVYAGQADIQGSAKVTVTHTGAALGSGIKSVDTHSSGKVIISGGTFSTEIPAEYCAEGLQPQKNSDGTWGVAPMVAVSDAVAEINGKYYQTLAAAVDAAVDHDTIKLLKSAEGGGVKVIGNGRHITIDLNNFTYTVINPTVGSSNTETNGFQLLKGTDVTFQNGTIKPGTAAAKILIQNYCNLTLDNVVVDCSGSNCEYASSNNFGSLIIRDSKIIAAKGQKAFDLYYWPTNGYQDGVSVTIEGNSEIVGTIEYGSDGTQTGTANVFDKATLTIKGGKFTGIISTYNLGTDKKANISVSGGTFTTDVSKYVIPGMKWDHGTGEIVIDPAVAVAEVHGVGYTSLTAALNAATDGQTVKLLANSTDNSRVVIQDGRKLTLDMNNFDAGFVKAGNISIYHGGLHITGSGKLYEQEPWLAPVVLYGSNNPQATDYTTVTVGKNVTLEGWAGLFLDQLKANSNGANAFGVTATVNGTLHSMKDTSGAGGHALYINGTIKATEGNVPEILLNGATLNTDLGNGIYLAGYAKTTIIDSTITSVGTDSTGIEIRAGELTVNGNSAVNGGTGEFVVDPNGNGSTTGNVALAVVQHTTKLPTVVTINGGTFSGGAALFEQNAQNNEPDAVAKIQVSVHGGVFEGQVYSENKTDFVTGGHFSQPVDKKYLDNDLNAQLMSASNPKAPYSYYTSLEAANAAAKPGDVVSTIQNVSDTKTYTVILNYNDGQSADLTYMVAENSSITLPTPTRSGYTFLGWYTGNTKVGSTYKVTGDVTLAAHWSYNSSSAPSGEYLINVDRVSGGKVTVNPGRADKGDTVTITVKPNDGYQLDKLAVTDKSGNSVKLTGKGDGKYTFTMPGSQVSVEASFVKTNVSPVDAFVDVYSGAWYYNAVEYAVENGLMSGTSSYSFEPNATLSRSMIAQMLYALEGKPSVSAVTTFNDVSANAWYAKAANWAQSKGIITGYDAVTFGPNDPVTREQMALILFNYAKLNGYNTSAKGSLNGFNDGASTSAWAQDAMTWAVGAGLLSGKGEGMLYPTGTATRAEVAQIMMNFCENIAK